HDTNHAAAVGIALGLIVVIFLIYALTSRLSRRRPRLVQRWLGFVLNPVLLGTLGRLKSRQEMKPEAISDYHIVNGPPPREDPRFLKMLWTDFQEWQLPITGLVEHPLTLTLADLRHMPKREHIIRHHCIQGWTGIAEWGGVPMSEIIARCHPQPNAKYVIFYSWAPDNAHRKFYEVLTMEQVAQPQTILAYEMNHHPLPLAHGAPLRLRCETVLGYKMVKWLCGIEFVESFSDIRAGRGGSREDNRYYEYVASI
ncbi:MAG TPA: molybdopterin-dependent oxidoreductase, partial [Ktedonobacterales bacterium]